MEKRYIIYRILNLKTRKFYIGRTTGSLFKRWSVHKANTRYDYKKSSKSTKSYLHRSMKKHGIENFEIKEIDYADDFEKLVFLEGFYIKYYQSNNPKYGYNSTIDTYGSGLEFVSEETKAKIRINSHNNIDRSGVSWDKFRKKWMMGFTYSDFKIKKRFKDETEAKEAYDKLALYFYKDNAHLSFPEKRQEYLKNNLEEFVRQIKYKKPKKSKFHGVHKDKNGFFTAYVTYNKDNLFLGAGKDEEKMAIIRDKVSVFLNKSIINFPELVTENYRKEGQEIFNKYTDPTRQRLRNGKKSSKYNGVYRYTINLWEMSIRKDNKRIRERFTNEIEAAKAYDRLAISLGIDKNKLNFP